MIFFYLQRQHHLFGPNGIKPPECGGPGSGFVCCSVGVGASGHTEFIKAPAGHGHHNHHDGPLHGSPSNFVGNGVNGIVNNRPSREQNGLPSQFNGNFGQCGRRNAEGLAGRIARPNFIQGDADFGKCFTSKLSLQSRPDLT